MKSHRECRTSATFFEKSTKPKLEDGKGKKKMETEIDQVIYHTKPEAFRPPQCLSSANEEHLQVLELICRAIP